jgi:hypothetical protein
VHLTVQESQVVERPLRIGPVDRRVLRRQLAPRAGGLLVGGFGLGETMRVVVKISQVDER